MSTIARTPLPERSGGTLQVTNIAHAFGGLEVLADVTFDAYGPGVVGLIGPNGSGKTTLFNIMSGFLKPKSGRVSLDGKDITGQSVQDRSRSGLLRTFQTPKVFDHMSVLENVVMGAYAHSRAGMFSTMLSLPSARKELTSLQDMAREVCHRFELDRLIDEQAGSLPAGQRRIVELARAYNARPRVLLLDEPSSGLSTPEIEELRQWIERLSSEGMSIVLVSHDMGLMSVCARVHVLYFGRIIASGPMDEIRENQSVRDAYLGG